MLTPVLHGGSRLEQESSGSETRWVRGERWGEAEREVGNRPSCSDARAAAKDGVVKVSEQEHLLTLKSIVPEGPREFTPHVMFSTGSKAAQSDVR